MSSVFVAGLDFGLTENELREAFEAYGFVKKASIALDRETGKSRGFGFVEMGDEDSADAAIRGLDGSTLKGRRMTVKKAEQRDDNRPKREFQPRNNEQRPYNAHQGPKADNLNTAYKKLDFEKPKNVVTPDLVNPIKEVRKKEVKKKEFDKDVKVKGKGTKMEAYKKSGKSNRFFIDDEDDIF